MRPDDKNLIQVDPTESLLLGWDISSSIKYFDHLMSIFKSCITQSYNARHLIYSKKISNAAPEEDWLIVGAFVVNKMANLVATAVVKWLEGVLQDQEAWVLSQPPAIGFMRTC